MCPMAAPKQSLVAWEFSTHLFSFRKEPYCRVTMRCARLAPGHIFARGERIVAVGAGDPPQIFVAAVTKVIDANGKAV